MGGGFLGYHTVTGGLAAARVVTVFSRSEAPPVPGVAVITGDRMGDLDGLHGHEFESVEKRLLDLYR